MDRLDVPTIRDLIRAALDAGRTVRQLADDSGGRVKFQTFQELANHPPKQFPKEPKTIEGMSQALGIPPATVVLAYAKGLGIDVSTSSSFVLRLPPGVDQVHPDMQDAIIGLTRAAVRTTSTNGAKAGPFMWRDRQRARKDRPAKSN